MKTIIALLLAFGIQAQASENIDVQCKVSDSQFVTATGVNAILIEDMLGEVSPANFPDAPKFDETRFENGKVILTYSNECDNYYSIAIPEAAVKRAHEVGIAYTRAEVEFSNPETSPEGGENARVISVSCVLRD